MTGRNVMTTVIAILVGFAVAIIIAAVGIYNGLVTVRNNVAKSFA